MKKMFRARSPHSSCSVTTARKPGMASTGPCAASPVKAAATAAIIPSARSVNAIGPINAMRSLVRSDMARNATPTNSKAIAKWTTSGCSAPMPDILIAARVPRREPTFSRSAHSTAEGCMQSVVRVTVGATCLAFALFLPAAAAAQGKQSVILRDPDPAGWEVAGHMAWLTVDNGPGVSAWNRWYDVATVGASAGRFIGSHVKVEFDASTSTAADVY